MMKIVEQFVCNADPINPSISIEDYSSIVKSFVTDLLPKLPALETSRSDVESDITSAKKELTSAESGIGSSWTSSTGLKVKDTLNNVIIEGVTRIETSLNTSFKTLLTKLGELQVQIDTINKVIDTTNKLSFGAYYERKTTYDDGTETTGAKYYVPKQDDIIETSKKLIELAIKEVEQTIQDIATAADGETLGIVGNVSNGGTLGAVTTMDLSNIDAGLTSLLPGLTGLISGTTLPSNSLNGDNTTDGQQGNTTTNDPMKTINDFENNLQGYIEYLKTRLAFTGAYRPFVKAKEFFKKEESIEALNETYKYQIALEKARISGSITQEQYEQGCKNVQSVYDNAWWGGSTFAHGNGFMLTNNISITEIVYAGDHLSKNLMKNGNKYYEFSESQRKLITEEVNSPNTVEHYLQLAESSTSEEDKNLYNRIAQEKTILGLTSGDIYYNDMAVAETKNTGIASIVNDLEKYQTGCKKQNDEEELVGVQYELYTE